MGRLGVWGAALALGVAPAAAAQQQPGAEDFAREMLALLAAANPDIRYVQADGDPLELHFRRPGDGEDGQLNLHNVFSFCARSDAESCADSKARFVRAMAARQQPIAAIQLRLVVRHANYLDALRGTAREPTAFVSEQVGEDLYALLAADSPDATAILTGSQLAELGLSRAAAWEQARRQTRERLPAIPSADQLRNGLVVLEGRDYLASLLIDGVGWAALAAEVGPDLFVTAVVDKLVIVGLAPDAFLTDSFREAVAADCAAAERCLSPNVYRFRKGGWQVVR